jgi:hypothetical protein
MPENVGATYENGVLVFRDTSGYVVDVIAPKKFIMQGCAAGAQGANTAHTQWAHAAVNSGTFQPGSGATGNYLVATTGTADLDDIEVASSLCFNSTKGLTLECRVATADADKTALAVGFSPIQEATVTDVICANIATATVSVNPDDGVFMFADYAQTSEVWNAITRNNGTNGTKIASTVVPADATFVVLKIEISTTGIASFWINGTALGSSSAAIRTVSPFNMFCAYFGFMNQGEGAANAGYISHFAAWQWNA